MIDFRLTVFYAVATRLSFTKAATDVHISQPAVSKHMRELENELKTRLFTRKGNKIETTVSGKILLKYVEQVRAISRDCEFEIHQLQKINKGKLKIGASTTIAQYVLPQLLAKFNAHYKNIRVELVVNNSEKISLMLEKGRIDCGLVEGKTHFAALRYIPFVKDEIVLVTDTKNKLAEKAITLPQLQHMEFVTRENGSGTQEYINEAFSKRGMDYSNLNSIIQLGSSEAIKNYLKSADAYAFLSVNAILQELNNGMLQIVDIEDFSIDRFFYFIMPTGEQAAIVQLFQKFLFHNQKL